MRGPIFSSPRWVGDCVRMRMHPTTCLRTMWTNTGWCSCVSSGALISCCIAVGASRLGGTTNKKILKVDRFRWVVKCKWSVQDSQVFSNCGASFPLNAHLEEGLLTYQTTLAVYFIFICAPRSLFIFCCCCLSRTWHFSPNLPWLLLALLRLLLLNKSPQIQVRLYRPPLPKATVTPWNQSQFIRSSWTNGFWTCARSTQRE